MENEGLLKLVALVAVWTQVTVYGKMLHCRF